MLIVVMNADPDPRGQGAEIRSGNREVFHQEACQWGDFEEEQMCKVLSMTVL